MPDADELLVDLQRVTEELGYRPSANEYREHGDHSVSAFYSTFDSWNAAKEQVEADEARSNPRKVSADVLIDDIQRVDEQTDGVPTKGDYESHGQYSITTVYRRFDSWPAAREEAGIDGRPTPDTKLSREALLAGLTSFAQELGETPTRRQMNDEGPYSGSAYVREFGNWNEALRTADLELNQPTDAELTLIKCRWCGTQQEREVAQIKEQSDVFCSRFCKHQFQASDEWGGTGHPLSERVERECSWCGGTVRRKPSVAANREDVFCGYGCMGEWRSRHVTGESHPRWKGGSEVYYGPNWHRQRAKRREVDEYECQACGMTDEESKERFGRELSVHHRKPVRSFLNQKPPDYEAMNQLTNLVTLCMTCHRKWEQSPVQPTFD